MLVLVDINGQDYPPSPGEVPVKTPGALEAAVAASFVETLYSTPAVVRWAANEYFGGGGGVSPGCAHPAR